MPLWLLPLLHSSYTHAAVIGIVTAAGVDLQAFRAWKTFHDFATYSWDTALFRWAQGGVLGLVAALGFSF